MKKVSVRSCCSCLCEDSCFRYAAGQMSTAEHNRLLLKATATIQRRMWSQYLTSWLLAMYMAMIWRPYPESHQTTSIKGIQENPLWPKISQTFLLSNWKKAGATRPLWRMTVMKGGMLPTRRGRQREDSWQVDELGDAGEAPLRCREDACPEDKIGN